MQLHISVWQEIWLLLRLHNPKYTLTRPDVSAFKVDNNNNPIKVTVENTDAFLVILAYLFLVLRLRSLQSGYRTLAYNRLRPINNVVDITNYVLQSLGQPMHAFDADKISGKHIIVKTLAEGTKFTTLDGVERTLNAADLMICDEKAVCVSLVYLEAWIQALPRPLRTFSWRVHTSIRFL
jgi:phenylalanyl-tRNA synthetase beta chain